jgi:arylsulfatase A-like enzyme
MRRRDFLQTVGLASVSVNLVGKAKAPSAKPEIKKAQAAKVSRNKPNILIFCTDQQRADHLGCAGHPVLKTPNIDRIAEQGVRLSSCFCSSPACMPARATMFTGLTNRVHGSRTNGVNLPEDAVTLPAILADNGYRTHAVGKLHLNAWSQKAPGVDIAKVETPEENPERLTHWTNGSIKKFPDNYYGFQTVDVTIGHVSYINGDYKVWLDENHPGAYKGLRPAGLKTINL